MHQEDGQEKPSLLGRSWRRLRLTNQTGWHIFYLDVSVKVRYRIQVLYIWQMTFQAYNL